MSLGKRSLCLAWGWAALCGIALAAEEYRNWSDSSGKNKMEAAFVSNVDGTVTLRTKAGKTFEIPLDKLSKADQTYIKQLDDNPFKEVGSSASMPAETKPEVKAKPDAKEVKKGKATTPAPSSDGSTQTVKVKRDRSEKIEIGRKVDWSYQPAGAAALGFKPKAISLPDRADIFEKMHGLAVNLNAKKAAFSFTTGKPGTDPMTRVFLGNLTNGKTQSSEPVKGEFAVLALADDGETILVRSNEFGHGKKDELQLWNLSQGENPVVKTLTAYEDSWKASNDIAWADFASNGEFVTMSSGGVLVGWNPETCQPVLHFQAAGSCIPAFSPDHSVIAVFSDQKELQLIDAAKRECVGVSNAPEKLSFPNLAFSPSGERIACSTPNRLIVWEGATGELIRDIKLTVPVNGGLLMPTEDYVLLGGQYLVNFENEIPLWQYLSVEQAVSERGLVLLAGGRKQGAIFPVSLPHPEAEKLLNDVMTQPDLVAFRAGDPVKLDVSKIPADQQSRVRDGLTKLLAEMKSSVSDAAPVVLTASVEGPVSKTMSYMHSGDFPVQEYTCKVDFLYDGQRAWGSSSTNIPWMLSLKKGENISTKLQELSAKPGYSFFETVRLPNLVLRPAKGANHTRLTLGSSVIDQK